MGYKSFLFINVLLLVSLFALYAHAHARAEEYLLYEKRIFCGDKLTRTLHKFCQKYYSTSTDTDYRQKRQIADECCKKACSVYDMLSAYCARFDIDEVIKYLLKWKRFPQFEDSGEITAIEVKRRR